MTFGFHLCRGNQASRWLVAGDYDWLAEQVFPRVRAQRLLLEYDDDALRRLRAARGRARGQARRPRAGDDEDGRGARRVEQLTGRIREAARVIPLERLALSPQCGFATSVLGNALTREDEEAKLRTIVETADLVWN